MAAAEAARWHTHAVSSQLSPASACTTRGAVVPALRSPTARSGARRGRLVSERLLRSVLCVGTMRSILYLDARPVRTAPARLGAMKNPKPQLGALGSSAWAIIRVDPHPP